jgi:PAS domain S-box-containing protein
MSRGRGPRRRPHLSVRANLFLVGALGVVIVVGLTAFGVGGLGPTAAHLSQESEAIVQGLAVLSGESRRLDLSLEEAHAALGRRTAVTGAVLEPGAGRTIEASLVMARVPDQMRIALAAAADADADAEVYLVTAMRQIEHGDLASASAHLAVADSLYAHFLHHVAVAEGAGLVTLAAKQAELVDLANRARALAPVWVGLSILFALLALLTLQRRVQRPLERLDRALQAVSAGDLAVALPADGDDEIDRLNSQFNRTVGILRATTQEQQRHAGDLRARLARILEESADEIFLIDAATRCFVGVNRQAELNLGYAAVDLQHMTAADLVDGDGNELDETVLAPLVEGRQAETVFRGHHRRKDGSTYPVRVRYQYGPEHDPPLLLGFGRDLTDELQQEERLRQSQRLEAVGQLTGGVAHDFNNLLTVIQGNIELLQEGLSGDAAARADAALTAARRGADLTARLLAFARRQSLAPRVVDVNILVANMIELLHRTLGEGLDIRVVPDEDVWNCEADPRQLEAALLNLAINARDAMEGRGTVVIETGNAVLDAGYAARQPEVEPGEYVMVAVTDAGCGIAADDLARVFEPFFTTKEPGRGTGLGLSMIYGFVKQSGGHVRIYSEVGEGTTVKIYLPRVQAHAENDSASAEEQPVPLGSGATVLVVEDNEDVLHLVEQYLRSLDYAVVSATDAAAGIALLEVHPEVTVLLSDVMLPGEHTGREFVEAAQRLRPGLPALFMSGYTENAMLVHGRLGPGMVLLQKPFSRADLARSLAGVLKG